MGHEPNKHWDEWALRRGWDAFPALLIWNAARLGLDGADLAIIALMMTTYDDRDRVYRLSYGSVVSSLGMARSTAIRKLNRLTSMGLIESQTSRTPGQRSHGANQYTMEGLNRALVLIGQNAEAGPEQAATQPGLRELLADLAVGVSA